MNKNIKKDEEKSQKEAEKINYSEHNKTVSKETRKRSCLHIYTNTLT
jgi:hypothetical protein